MAREHPIGEPDENDEPHENDGEEGGGEAIHVHGTGRGGNSGGGNTRPNNAGNIPSAPRTNPDASRPESGGGGNALYQGNITIRGSAPPPAEDGKAYVIAGTIIGGTRTGTKTNETITGATISDATLIIHPDSAHPQAGGKTLHTKLSEVTLHISRSGGVITHYTLKSPEDLGTPVADKTGNTGSPAFEPMKTGLPTDIHIDPSTFYPQPGEPLSPPASPPKPEKDPAPAPSEPEHKKKKHHHHHHHRHHKH
ncbi:hypothetical protein RF55_8755 [Lasius niger]|uniref:Uncharacterized protein n=1 Tax=Lasius niger TaxID=67767 RepID=A0A0J7NFN3_LASNI|nr:hypothetical protein RF55_8755 [Lasius niger]